MHKYIYKLYQKRFLILVIIVSVTIGVISINSIQYILAKMHLQYQQHIVLSLGGMTVLILGLISALFYQKQKMALLKQQFYQAQKMESLGRLAGGIAHDFNNSLASISGYADLLKDDLHQQKDLQNFAHQIICASDQAKKLVEQILSFSRKTQVQKEPFNLTAHLVELISLFQATIDVDMDIKIETDIPTKDIIINGNANQIYQMLMNVCVNASDAINQEFGVIQIQLSHLKKERDIIQKSFRKNLKQMPLIQNIKNTTTVFLGHLEKNIDYTSIIIKDNGEGISKYDLSRMFDPFFTTKDMKGTGLGLSIVHSIIETHDGAVIVESSLNKGTHFEIILPLYKISELEQKHLKSKNIPTEGKVFGQGSILIVEDEISVANALSHNLERLGYETLHCLNGLEAIELLGEVDTHYDLMITDYKMPGMTGLELSKKVSVTHPDMPIIMISGYSEETLETALKKGYLKKVLKKPVDIIALSHDVQELIKSV